ncbi:DNA helicase UvrD [Enterococcus sp. JM4C]|uniref:UvrD-helicase domain-containing protein n=1 Tax=Candidatus Enterococcus huntleyi TaxID=1857217 RepID=UPI0013798955|nr:ATP-dependent helicase [Enterococcus sp. JM4C]KAF1299347.1 DNA helicase UvrD [Enterococcus sp. JM4C]
MRDRFTERVLDTLSICQKEVVLDCENNLFVTACPGSGKTRTLTRKIAYMSNLYPESLKKIVAITYTNRAANEINTRLDKLNLNESHIWVGTIHQFCLDFIIRKFGLNLKRTSRGIKIIDEYVTSKYLKEIYENYGIEYNPYEHPNLMVSTSGKYYEEDDRKRKIVIDYHRKLKQTNEIDFDLILMLALKILEENPISTQIISNNIRSIFVDEYQDTNEFQYQILGQLAKTDKSIKFMFVGDSDQAIFTSLGGVVKNKKEIEKITGLEFLSKKLNGCYRSTQRIVDLYSHFQSENYKIKSLSSYSEDAGVIEYDKETHKDNLSSRIAEIIQDLINAGVSENEICVIAPNQFILTPIAKDLKKELPNLHFQSQDVYPIKPDNLNLFYKISFLVFTPIGERIRLRKTIANEIIHILKNDFAVTLSPKFKSLDLLDILNSAKSIEKNGLTFLRQKIMCLFDFLEIERALYPDLYQAYEDFFAKAIARINNKRLELSTDINDFRNIYKEKSGINISTIHKVKGEEYEVVIAFGFLQDIVPHFKSKNPEKEARKLLYVTISRAKKRVYLFSERGRQNNWFPEKRPTDILKNVEII